MIGGDEDNAVGHTHYIRERIKTHEVNQDTYSIIVTASSLVLGYSTYGPNPPKLSEWGSSLWGYYVFAMIIPLAYLMNLYTVLVLVLSRYNGQRTLKMDQRDLDRLLLCKTEEEAEGIIVMAKVQSRKRYLQYMAKTSTNRHCAVLSFISSLPLLLLSLAAKQYDTLPEVVAIPTSVVLFIGTTVLLGMVVMFVANEGREFMETRKLDDSAATRLSMGSISIQHAAPSA